jgi:N-acetyl-anhydromuramyl-L-alanine amidase AmpD
MRKRKLLALTTVGILLQLFVHAQQNILGLETYFEEAYWRYPNIPRGLLEATAYSASRITNLEPSASDADNCSGMPPRYGLYALIENGRGYFKNNLLTVCNNSSITPEQYKKDVRLQILSVAKFLSREASIRQMDARTSAEAFSVIFDKLAEFPDDSSATNKYALALFKYDIYDHLRNGFNTPSLKRAPVKVQLTQIFPAPLLRKLQSPAVQIDAGRDSIRFTTTVMPADAGNTIFASNHVGGAPKTTEDEGVAADYSPAMYVRAHNNNYQSGRNAAKISHLAIHTTQGSYAGTISWFRNPAAHMSAHYIIRATDGQVTQMVNENDMAYHVQGANANTIGIEHECYMEYGNKWYSDKMYRASAALVRDICARRAIDETSCYGGVATAGTNAQPAAIHIKGHQHYSGVTNTDPGKYWNWNKYANLLQEQYKPDTEEEIQFMSIPNGIYRITNVGSKKVMNTRDCSGNQLARVTQTAWNGKDCQRWRFEYAGDGCYKITNLVSGRALEVPGGSKNNVQVQLKDAKENDSQLWRLLETGSKGQLRLVNKASGKVLEVFAGSANNGAAVLQSAWTGKSRQKWMLVAVTEKEESAEEHHFRQVNLETTEAVRQ